MGKSNCDKKIIKNKVPQNQFYTNIQTKYAFGRKYLFGMVRIILSTEDL